MRQRNLGNDCKCKMHTYARWAQLTSYPEPDAASTPAVRSERARKAEDRQRFAMEVNELFKLIPDRAWPNCKDARN